MPPIRSACSITVLGPGLELTAGQAQIWSCCLLCALYYGMYFCCTYCWYWWSVIVILMWLPSEINGSLMLRVDVSLRLQFVPFYSWALKLEPSWDNVLIRICHPFPSSPQYVEAISNKQGELDSYIAEGYKNALSEERRRYCFLVDRQCAVAKNSSAYHSKVRRICWCHGKMALMALLASLTQYAFM